MDFSPESNEPQGVVVPSAPGAEFCDAVCGHFQRCGQECNLCELEMDVSQPWLEAAESCMNTADCDQSDATVECAFGTLDMISETPTERACLDSDVADRCSNDSIDFALLCELGRTVPDSEHDGVVACLAGSCGDELLDCLEGHMIIPRAAGGDE